MEYKKFYERAFAKGFVSGVCTLALAILALKFIFG